MKFDMNFSEIKPAFQPRGTDDRKEDWERRWGWSVIFVDTNAVIGKMEAGLISNPRDSESGTSQAQLMTTS